MASLNIRGAVHAPDPMLTAPNEFVQNNDTWLAHLDDGSNLLAMIFEEWSSENARQHQQEHVQERPNSTGRGEKVFDRGSRCSAVEGANGDGSMMAELLPGTMSGSTDASGGSAAGRSSGAQCKRGRKKQEASPVVGSGSKTATSATTPSRWRQSQCRMGGLEAEAKKQSALADEAVQLNTELKFRELALEHTLAARDKQVQILKAHRAGVRGFSPTPTSSESSHSCSFSLSGDASGHETTNSLVPNFDPATATVQSLAAQVRHFVSQASILLLQISGSEASGADNADKLEKLAHMVHTFCGHMGSVFVLNTQTQFEVLARRLDCEGSGPESLSTPPPGHWDLVVKEMHATPSQLREVVACWELNGAAMMKLQDDIQAVTGQLSEAVAKGRDGAAQCMELQQRLSTALLNQALTCRAMGYILFGRILTPLQTARAIVHSFPYFPNGRELLMRLMEGPGGGGRGAGVVTVSTGLRS